MRKDRKITRRTSLKSAAAASGTLAIPYLGFAKREKKKKNKKQGKGAPAILKRSPNALNIALIGAGGIAKQAYSGCQGENIVALCDVDFNYAAKLIKQEDLENVPRFSDFRKMFDKMGNQIDAFVVSTPDHTHFSAAMEGIQRGKHAYVQKPLCHDIWQVRTLKKAARRYKIISQMGNQGHATEHIRLIKEWYDAGLLGNVSEVYAWFPGPKFGSRYFARPASLPPPESPLPEGFEYDLWLGPAQQRPFNELYHPRRWRGFWDFGTGQFGDWACHTIDAPVWALNLKAPISVSAELSEVNPIIIPTWSKITYQFPATEKRGPVTLKWYDGGKRPEILETLNNPNLANATGGMMMVGDKNILLTGVRPNYNLQLVYNFMEIKKSGGLPPKTLPRAIGCNPFKEWIAAIKNEGPMPGSNFDYAAQLTEMALIGTLVQRTGRNIEWDHENMKAKGQPELNRYIKVPPRKGWSYGEDLWS